MMAILVIFLMASDLRSQILSAWQEHSSALGNGFSATIHMTVKRPAESPLTFSYILKRKGHAFVYSRNRAHSEEQVLDGRNAYYCFQLKRPHSREAWALSHIASMQTDQECFPNSAKQVSILSNPALFPGPTIESSLVDILSSPNSEVSQQNSGAIIIAFRRSNSKKQSGFPIEGKVELRPSPPYLPLRATFIVEYHDEQVVREQLLTEMTYSGNTFFSLSRMTRSGRLVDVNADTGVVEYDFEHCEANPELPDSEFSLSAFGLEEYHGVTWPKPTPYWLYGTLGSIAVIVLGILLMRWSQRRSARAVG